MNVIDSHFEEIVRHRAYALWESEGRPFGRDVEHWRLSEELTRAEFLATPAKKKAPARKKASAKSVLSTRAADISISAHH